MTQVVEKNSVIEVHGQDFDMKLDPNRKIYIKSNLIKDQYHFIDARLPPGMSRPEKKNYMYNLYIKVEEAYNDKKESEQNYKSGEIKDANTKDEDEE